MPHESYGGRLPNKSPLSKLEQQTKRASRLLEQQGLDESKPSAVSDLIKQTLHPKSASKAEASKAGTKSEAAPEKVVFEAAGEFEGADLSRSNAIKRAVARPQRVNVLHRSNAVKGDIRTIP